MSDSLKVQPHHVEWGAYLYLHAYESVGEARRKIGCYLEFYDSRRPHSSLGGTDSRPCILTRSAKSSGGLTRDENRRWKC